MTKQLTFDGLFETAAETNKKRTFDRQYAHLPSTMEEAVTWMHDWIDRYHGALMAGAFTEAEAIEEEPHDVAVKLNGGNRGILAHDDAPGYVLERLTAAPEGTVPRWGQKGDFVLVIDETKVRVELDGAFGIGFGHGLPGFKAHVVDRDKPFPISETGYRSFIGHTGVTPRAGLTPEQYAREAIQHHLATRPMPRKSKRKSSRAPAQASASIRHRRRSR